MENSMRDFALKNDIENSKKSNWAKRGFLALGLSLLLSSLNQERLMNYDINPEELENMGDKQIHLYEGDIAEQYRKCMKELGANIQNNQWVYVQDVLERNDDIEKESEIIGDVLVPDCNKQL